MHHKKISIIIPCYNCERTLAEALSSVYRQNLSVPFEIVLVDDASTDRTREVMNSLANKHKEIRCFFHAKNRGGGATRNTAVEKTEGNIIFCLDSDDLLGDGTLDKMLTYLTENNYDAAGISESIKFSGTNQNDVVRADKFGYIGEQIPFISLFQAEGRPNCPLYSVFMFSKNAWQIAGGYPTHHGFDTQGFAWRFLGNGLRAGTCPQSIYWHRVNFTKSYYLREYESGKVNHNWFIIYEEFLYLFRPEMARKILEFDLNDPDHSLSELITNTPIEDILKADYAGSLVPHAQSTYERGIRSGEYASAEDHYWLGSKLLREDNQSEALLYLKLAFESGMRNAHLYDKLLSLQYPFTATEHERATRESSDLYRFQKYGSQAGLLTRIWRKILRAFRKKYSSQGS